MAKLSEIFKKYSVPIIVSLCIVISIGSAITYVQVSNYIQNANDGKMLIPDRIIYRTPYDGAAGVYYIFNKDDENYNKLLANLKKNTGFKIDYGKHIENVSFKDIMELQQGHEFINLDYYNQDYSYIIPLSENNRIIRLDKRTGWGAAYEFTIKNIDDTKKLINNETQNITPITNTMAERYFDTAKKSQDLVGFESLGGIFSDVFIKTIPSGSKLTEFLSANNLSISDQDIEQYTNCNIIAVATMRDMKSIQYTPGTIILGFTSNNVYKNYYIRLEILSPVYSLNNIYEENLGYTYEVYQELDTSIEESAAKFYGPNAITEPVPEDQLTPIKITEKQAKEIAINALHEDGIKKWEEMSCEQTINNLYGLERWTDSNKDYSHKYEPVTECKYVRTWHVTMRDADNPGCGVNIWIDAATGEVLCYHWTGE